MELRFVVGHWHDVFASGFLLELMFVTNPCQFIQPYFEVFQTQILSKYFGYSNLKEVKEKMILLYNHLLPFSPLFPLILSLKNLKKRTLSWIPVWERNLRAKFLKLCCHCGLLSCLQIHISDSINTNGSALCVHNLRPDWKMLDTPVRKGYINSTQHFLEVIPVHMKGERSFMVDRVWKNHHQLSIGLWFSKNDKQWYHKIHGLREKEKSWTHSILLVLK